MTGFREGCGRLCSEARAAWAIARKDMRIYYIKPNIIVSGLLFPLFMFLAFAVGREAAPVVLIPGLVSITILFSSSSIEPVSIPIERRVKTFDRLLSAPISLQSVVLGESLSGFLYSIVIGLVPLCAGVILFHLQIRNPVALAAGFMLTAFCFASMGTLFAAYPTESPGDIMSMLNLVRLPLIFASGIFIPVSALPPVGQAAVLFSPLTYGNDLIHMAFEETGSFPPVLDVGIILVFIAGFQFAAQRLYKKFNE